MALDKKLYSTCCNFAGSVCMIGTSRPTVGTIDKSFFSASGLMMLIRPSNKSRKLIARADVGADVQIAFADFLGRHLKHADRAEDQARGDQIENDDGQYSRDHAGQKNHDAI